MADKTNIDSDRKKIKNFLKENYPQQQYHLAFRKSQSEGERWIINFYDTVPDGFGAGLATLGLNFFVKVSM